MRLITCLEEGLGRLTVSLGFVAAKDLNWSQSFRRCWGGMMRLRKRWALKMARSTVPRPDSLGVYLSRLSPMLSVSAVI